MKSLFVFAALLAFLPGCGNTDTKDIIGVIDRVAGQYAYFYRNRETGTIINCPKNIGDNLQEWELIGMGLTAEPVLTQCELN